MYVEDVMTTSPVTVTPSTSVKHALELLERHRVTSLPVLEGHRLRGIVSEADLIRDLVSDDPRAHLSRVESRSLHPSSVGDVMTRHAVSVRPDTDLAVAVDLMTTTTVKSVPVVDAHGHVVGMLSRSDVVRSYARADESLEREARTALASVGLDDWMVEVRDGVAELTDAAGRDSADTALARVMVSHVPGVVDVRAG